jgi:hypothetical protein
VERHSRACITLESLRARPPVKQEAFMRKMVLTLVVSAVLTLPAAAATRHVQSRRTSCIGSSRRYGVPSFTSLTR